MKRAIAILACTVAFMARPASGTPQQGTLRWTNGETMPGDVVEATGTSITWKSPVFEEPVTLGWDVVHRIDWPAEGAPAGDPFIFSLRDGSTIYGDLVGITGSSISVHGSRYGDAELKRTEVLGARRIKGGALLTEGPTGDAGWQEFAYQENGMVLQTGSGNGASSNFTPLVAGPGGALRIPFWNRGAKLDLKVPDSVDVEFHVHSTGRLDFRLSLEEGDGRPVRIETWDSDLVVALAKEFMLIRKIGDAEHDVALRFCWNSKMRHCSVYTPAGDLLVEWQAPEDHGQSDSDVLLLNKGRDLSLDFLRIRAWDGSPPPKVDLSKPRLELADGRVLPGQVASGTAGSIHLKSIGADQSDSTFALKDVDALIFSPDPPADVPAAATLSYADGSRLSGSISAIQAGAVTLNTPFAAQPLVASLDGLRQLFVNTSPNIAPEDVFAKLDRLNIGQATLHGTLVAAGEASPRWLPVGALAPVTPSSTMPYEIVRVFPDDVPMPAVPALFYTRAGDVLPGNLHALDRTGIEFDSSIATAAKLPAGEVAAIQFGASGNTNLHGFTDPSWRVLKGDDSKVHIDGDSLEMEPGTAIGNASAMQSSDICFAMDLGGAGFSAVRLRMFCAGSNSAKSKNLLFFVSGNQIACGEEAPEGQFGTEIQAVPAGNTVQVRLAITEKSVDIYLNGLCVDKVAISAESRPGSGLIIEPGSVWGNSAQPIKLSSFSLSSAPGGTWLPDVDPDAKAQALTVPRFRRDDPPTHALIAANGDILRGEIEAATTENFGFRSGMEELVVPRNRVKAVIWLGKPREASASPASQDPAGKLLGQQIDMSVRFRANLATFVGWLQSACAGLQIKYPDDAGTGIQAVALGNETLGAALDQICALYSLSYRVDDNGVIVLEPARANSSSRCWEAAISISPAKRAKSWFSIFGPPGAGRVSTLCRN